MKLRIKPEHNPPKIGIGEEEGLIATQEVFIDEKYREKYSDELVLASKLNSLSDRLIEQFVGVEILEIKDDEEGD